MVVVLEIRLGDPSVQFIKQPVTLIPVHPNHPVGPVGIEINRPLTAILVGTNQWMFDIPGFLLFLIVQSFRPGRRAGSVIPMNSSPRIDPAPNRLW